MNIYKIFSKKYPKLKVFCFIETNKLRKDFNNIK